MPALRSRTVTHGRNMAGARALLRATGVDNWLTASIALAAPLFWWAGGYSLIDIAWQLAVAAGAFVALAGLFALRWMGGGDVKLLTALALWLRPQWFLELLVVMALVGGVMTIAFGAWLIARRQRDRVAVPYGIAVAFAGLWVLAQSALPALQHGSPLG